MPDLFNKCSLDFKRICDNKEVHFISEASDSWEQTKTMTLVTIIVCALKPKAPGT